MMPRWLLAWCALAALIACKPTPSELSGIEPRPALWEVTGKNGQTGWLFGTVHSLPDGVEWLTPATVDTLDRSGVLVLEIAKLDDASGMAGIFARLAHTAGQPPLTQRVPAYSRPALARLLDQAHMDEADFADMESWAAALTLAQAIKTGDSENGVDRALRDLASGKDVTELEGTERQLGIFDALPEQDQRDLLAAIAEGADTQGAEELALARHWLTGDIAAIDEETHRSMLADTELREALLVRRNRDWVARIAGMIEQGKQPFVAVGAAHMAGKDGLPALLSRSGWAVRRLQ